jgi:TolB-like protein
VLALALAAIAVMPASGGSRAPTRPTVAVVDFRNVTGDPAAVPEVMAAVKQQLARRGFEVVGNGRIDRFLRERRIRARDALSREHVQELAWTAGARYLLVGAVDAWVLNGGPEVGLTARLLDAADGSVRWADEACIHAVDAPGLLAMGRPKTLPQATVRAARKLFESLVLKKNGGFLDPQMPRKRPTRRMLAPVPIAYRSPYFDPTQPMLVAVLPLENRSSAPDAPLVIGDRLLSQMLAMRNLDVVDPGELRRTLIDNDIQPLYGVSPQQMRKLRELLGIDAVLDGSILRYENGTGSIPRIDLFVRLRDTETGEIRWSATTSRSGERTRTVYDVGRIQGVDRLAESALSELLSTWMR